MARNGAGAGVVAGGGEHQVALPLIGEHAKKAGAGEDVLPRIEGIRDAHRARGEGHELHDPRGAVGRHDSRVKRALDMRHGVQVGRRQRVEGGGFAEVGLETCTSLCE